MRYLSLFSGIEAASVAWEPLGWEPIAFAEIEPFPSAVLAARFPDVPNLGDVTKVDWSQYAGTVDVLVGGSPCQAFSTAGKRGGLMDARGRLMLEFVRACREARPRFVLWENVPGVLSQDGGRAFGTLLRELEDSGYSCAWRVLDAQFFGVPQRRRRVFLVGCARAGRSAAILFEPQGMPWHPKPSQEVRQELALHARGGSSREGDCIGVQVEQPSVIAYGIYDEATPKVGVDVMPTIRRGGEGGTPLAVAFAQNQRDEVRLIGGDGEISGAVTAEKFAKQQTYVCMASGQANSEVTDGDVSSMPTTLHKTPIICIGNDMAHGAVTENIATALTTRCNQQFIIMPSYSMVERCGKPGGGKGPLLYDETSHTIRANGMPQTVFQPNEERGAQREGKYTVRRLTPRECERLQGFPDDWTRISWNGKPEEQCPDGPRYKATGNSMAVPVMRWIGERIQEVDKIE